MQEFSMILVNLPAMFLCIAFAARFLGQLGRADFYNPLGQTTLSITNWIIKPLRKVVPSIGLMDTSCLVAIYLTQLVFGALVFAITGNGFYVTTPQFFLAALLAVAGALITVLSFSMFIVAIASFLLAGQYNPFIAFITQIIEPFIGPFRKLNIQVGMLDLSFLLAILALQAIKYIALLPAGALVGYPGGLFFGF
ncbi:YggT family protein [Marinicellulosiphila megalodicopiae]|uniref:YggT family protein n=1 Tax=Marinicellulosiphila megalodicopiae TaxID=2724896 RepID=UPI003BB2022B